MIEYVLLLGWVLLFKGAVADSQSEGDQTDEIRIYGVGSTLAQPIYASWIYGYSLKYPYISITYNPIGSGAGKTVIVAGQADFAGTDSPFTTPVTNIKIYPFIGAAVVAFENIAGLSATDPQLILDGLTLSLIFEGVIKRWNDPAIVNTNPNLNLPNASITVIYRTDQSGTTDIFTSALKSFNPLSSIVPGENWSSNITSKPGYIGADGNIGIFARVILTPNSIGYLTYSYVKQYSDRWIMLKNSHNELVQPTPEAIAIAMDGAVFDDSFSASLVNSNRSDTWPIAAFTYLALPTVYDANNCTKVFAMYQYFKWCLTSDVAIHQAIVSGYAPLSTSLSNLVLDRMGELSCGDKNVFWVEPYPSIKISWQEPAGLAIGVITFIYLAIQIITGILMVIFRNEDPIKGASVKFMAFILTGLFLVDIVILLWNQGTTPVICQIQVWLAAIAFILIYGSIFCKTWRLYRLWTAPLHKIRSKTMNDTSLILFLGALLVIQIIILIVWTIVDPFNQIAIEVTTDNIIYNQLSCGTNYSFMQVIIFVYMGLILIVCAGVAFLTRKLPKNYREAKWIGLCVYNTIFCAILIPISSSLNHSVITQFLLLAIGLLWTSLGVFVSLFVVKVIAAIKPGLINNTSLDISHRETDDNVMVY